MTIKTTRTTSPQTATSTPAAASCHTAARTRALAAGVCYLITFASSAAALALERPFLSNAGFIVSTGPDSKLVLGGVLDLINALAAVSTAVVLYPLLRQRHPGLAIGFVTSRVAEGAAIVTSVAAILSLVTLHDAGAGATGADRTSLMTAGMSLIAMHDWTFLLGPGLIPAINALLLGTMMYRTGMVPRVIPVIGLIGAPILLASATATMFGLYGQVSAAAGLAALPVAVWELSLGLWMTIKGFRPAAFPLITPASSPGDGSGRSRAR